MGDAAAAGIRKTAGAMIGASPLDTGGAPGRGRIGVLKSCRLRVYVAVVAARPLIELGPINRPAGSPVHGHHSQRVGGSCQWSRCTYGCGQADSGVRPYPPR